MSPSLPERSLGSQGFKGSALGYGCMSLTDFCGNEYHPSKEGAEATLKHVLDTGITVLNTSDLYGPYINEELVGKPPCMTQLFLVQYCTVLHQAWSPVVLMDQQYLGHLCMVSRA